MLCIVKNGYFTGTRYLEDKPEYRIYHAHIGELAIWYTGDIVDHHVHTFEHKPTLKKLTDDQMLEAQSTWLALSISLIGLDWLSPTLLNGWEAYDETPQYCVDSFGVLHIVGIVRYGSLNYPILQLQEAARPSRNIRKVVPMREGFGLLDINTQGYVIPRGDEELVYDETTGAIVEVGYLSLEVSVML